MGLTARRSRAMRARSRAAVAVIVVASWFGTLLIAAPVSSPAAATPADPTSITIAGPTGTGGDKSPTWTFDLPADDPGSPTAVPSDVAVDPSDTATATIATTHRGECFVGTAAPASTDYVSCTTPTGTANRYSYQPTLSLSGDYTFYVHDVETSTITTTIQHADTSPDSTVVSGPTSTPGSDATSAVYTLDATGPSLTVTAPTSSGTDPTPTWSFSTDGVSVDCALSDGTTTPGCTSPYTPTLSGDGSYSLTLTAKDSFGNTTVDTSTYTLQTAGAPGITGPATGSSTTPTFTLTAPAGVTPADYSVPVAPRADRRAHP